jgi:hypothetical protein
MWVLLTIGGGMLLVLAGASLLFSFEKLAQVDWRVCAALCICVCIFLPLLFFSAPKLARSVMQSARRR